MAASGLSSARCHPISAPGKWADAVTGMLEALIAVLALLVLAPVFAWIGRRHGRRIRGNIVMASFLLGLGQAMDPPPAQKVEAAERRARAGLSRGSRRSRPMPMSFALDRLEHPRFAFDGSLRGLG